MVTGILQTNDPVELLGDVTLHDPFAAALLVAGVVVMGYTMGVLGYQSALAHGEGGELAQTLSGVAFGVAILVGAVAIVAIHVYE